MFTIHWNLAVGELVRVRERLVSKTENNVADLIRNQELFVP